MNKGKVRALWMGVQMGLGLLLTALAYRLFLIPNGIAAGGFTGIGQLVNAFTGLPVGAIALALNVPLFAFSLRQLGFWFGLRSIVASVGLSLLLDHLPIGAMTDDPMLAAVFGGVLSGAGLGLVLRGGATTGGSDMLGKLISRHRPVMTIGAVTFLVDALVIVASGFVFDAGKAMLALISAYLMNRVMDTVIEGPNLAKAYYIISDESERIAERILCDLARGVTGISARGMYSDQPRTMLLCVINRMETVQLRRIVAELDPRAFMIATNVHEALGEGFQPHQ